MKFLQHLATVQGRLLTGFSLVVAIVVGLWPDHARPFDSSKAAAIATALLAWLFAEISSAGEPQLHDINLFGKITENISENFLNFLREHDFGASYMDPGVSGMYAVARWEGSRFDFSDKQIHKQWKIAQAELRNFSRKLALNTFPVHDSKDWYTVHPTHGDPENPADFVQERIDLLNEAASNLVDCIDKFESFARRRLRL